MWVLDPRGAEFQQNFLKVNLEAGDIVSKAGESCCRINMKAAWQVPALCPGCCSLGSSGVDISHAPLSSRPLWLFGGSLPPPHPQSP